MGSADPPSRARFSTVKAIHSWQHHIENSGIEMFAVNEAQPLDAIARGVNPMAIFGQPLLNHVSDALIVLDD